MLAYSNSAQIDSDGKRVGDSYHAYYEQSDAQALIAGVVLNARVFAERYLAVRNLILNVSSVLARREVFLAALREQYRTRAGLFVRRRLACLREQSASRTATSPTSPSR